MISDDGCPDAYQNACTYQQNCFERILPQLLGSALKKKSDQRMQNEDSKAVAGELDKAAPSQRRIELLCTGGIKHVHAEVEEEEPFWPFQRCSISITTRRVIEQKHDHAGCKRDLDKPLWQSALLASRKPHTEKE